MDGRGVGEILSGVEGGGNCFQDNLCDKISILNLRKKEYAFIPTQYKHILLIMYS